MTGLLLVLIPLGVLGMISAASLTAAETAMLSVSRTALFKGLEGSPERVRRRVLHQHEDTKRSLAALGLGCVVSDSLMAVAITAIVFETMDGWVVPVLISLGLAVVASFLVSSVSPRTVGRRNPVAVSIRLSGLIELARRVMGPLATLLIHIGSAFTPGGKVDGGPYAIEAELRDQVDRALEAEALEHTERDMIQSVFDLGDTIVREIMVPRTDVITVDGKETAIRAMRLFVRSGYSRIPVIGDDVDDVLGVLYVKDVMRTIHSPWDPRPDRPVTAIMRQPMFIPESVSADEVLRQMQASRVHIAMVVDEYGGISGMVTIEDVLEEIVGEIADEHDREEPGVEDLGSGVFRVPARQSIDETGELFDLDVDDEDVDSIGGLLAKTIGRIPIPGSTCEIMGMRIEAERTAGRRKQLSTVLVSRALPARALEGAGSVTIEDAASTRTGALRAVLTDTDQHEEDEADESVEP
jgi:CBS domain containing-hemolysin-like protein